MSVSRCSTESVSDLLSILTSCSVSAQIRPWVWVGTRDHAALHVWMKAIHVFRHRHKSFLNVQFQSTRHSIISFNGFKTKKGRRFLELSIVRDFTPKNSQQRYPLLSC